MTAKTLGKMTSLIAAWIEVGHVAWLAQRIVNLIAPIVLRSAEN